MLDVPRGYKPNENLLFTLFCRLHDNGLYQTSLNMDNRPGTITLGLSHFSFDMMVDLDWQLGDALIAHQLVALDLDLLNLFIVDEEALEERQMLLDEPALLAKMPHHAMQSLVFGQPRVDAYIVYLSESRFVDNREKCCTMWGIFHDMDLVPPNLGDPLMHPYYYHLELFNEEIYTSLKAGRFLSK